MHDLQVRLKTRAEIEMEAARSQLDNINVSLQGVANDVSLVGRALFIDDRRTNPFSAASGLSAGIIKAVEAKHKDFFVITATELCTEDIDYDCYFWAKRLRATRKYKVYYDKSRAYENARTGFDGSIDIDTKPWDMRIVPAGVSYREYYGR